MTEKYRTDEQKEKKKSIWLMIIILVGLFIFSFIIAGIIGIFSDNSSLIYNTAIIPVSGEITTEASSGLFANNAAGSSDIVAQIENAKNDPNVKAVIFEINSPGGSPVATDEIATAIKSLRQKNITTVAYIREVGASGAYWVASSSEHIIANKMSIVGSIGVYSSYIEWYGLMTKYNVSYKRMVSGEYKDTGTPYRSMSSAEEAYMQEKLDKLHLLFIDAVASNRNLSVDTIKTLADGKIFLGVEAKENGLIDELGGKQEAINYLKIKLKTEIDTKEFVKDKSFLESLMETMNKNSFYVGQGMASYFVKATEMKIKI